MITIYESWEIDKSPVLPRSRLYCLEPIGIGTPQVESLISYIARLAEAHSTSVGRLLTREISPVLNKAYLQSSSNGIPLLGKAAYLLNGTGGVARDWSQALEELTLRSDLRFLTLMVWGNVLPNRHLARRNRVWCPVCLEDLRKANQIIYEPLLWTFEAVTLCPQHGCALDSICQHCKQKLNPLSYNFHLGYCSKCQKWLGFDKDIPLKVPLILEKQEQEFRIWVSISIGELLRTAPNLPYFPSGERVVESVSRCVDQICKGKPSLFSRLVQIPAATLYDWRKAKGIPTLNLLLKTCFYLRIPLLDFLMGKAYLSNNNPNPAMSLGFVSAKFLERARKKECLHQMLLSALKEDPPPSISEIVRRSGYKGSSPIRWHYPDLVEMLKLRRQALARSGTRFQSIRRKAHDDDTIIRALESAINQQADTSVTEVARSLGYKNATSIRNRFPDLCAKLIRMKKERIRAAIESALKDEPPPTMRDVARRLGYTADSSLRITFPALCRRVSARRKEFIIEAKNGMRLLLLSVLKENPPPSRQEVARRLNISATEIARNFPDLSRAVSKRYLEYKHETVISKRECLKAKIRSVIVDFTARGIFPSAKQVSESLGNRRRVNYSSFSRLFHEV